MLGILINTNKFLQQSFLSLKKKVNKVKSCSKQSKNSLIIKGLYKVVLLMKTTPISV